MSGPREIFDCARVRSYLDSYLEGQVPPPEARAIGLHVQRCPACHGRVVGRDPLKLFAPLSEESRGEAFWEGFWPAIEAEIRKPAPAPRLFERLAARPALAWGALAAMLLIGALALLRPWDPPGAPQPGESVMGPRVSEGIDLPPIASSSMAPLPPAVEEVRSPTARVLTMKVFGEDREVTDVVLIVDEAIDL